MYQLSGTVTQPGGENFPDGAGPAPMTAGHAIRDAASSALSLEGERMCSDALETGRLVSIGGLLFPPLFVAGVVGLTRNYDDVAARRAYLDGEPALILAGALVTALAWLAFVLVVAGLSRHLRMAGADDALADVVVGAGLVGTGLLLVSTPVDVAVAATVGGDLDPDTYQVLRDLAHWLAALGYAALGLMALTVGIAGRRVHLLSWASRC
jgi:hypothetical protein